MTEPLEQIIRTFKGGREDKTVLYSFWKHFPYIDQDPERLAEAHIAYYHRYKFDLMKISPHGRYSAIDFGCEIAKDVDPISGSTKCKSCKIKKLDDWETVETVDVGEGEFGKQLRVIEKIAKNGSVTIPKMMTIFSPLMTASKLDPNIGTHIKKAPKVVQEGLDIIASVTKEFAKASLDVGAEGLFIASQHLQKGKMEWKDIEKYEICYLHDLYNTIRNRADFSVLHIHGEDIYFKETIENLTYDAVNWHDQHTPPSLLDASELFPGGLLGGIDERGMLLKEKPETIEENIKKILMENKAILNRMILAPGCVIPFEIPHEKMLAITNAIKNFSRISDKYEQ